MDTAKMGSILSGRDSEDAPHKLSTVKIKAVTLKRYFHNGESSADIQKTSESALALYFSTNGGGAG